MPIYIAEFAHPWLKRSLSSVINKSATLIEIPARSEINVGQGLKMNVFAADTCHPSICKVSIPCQPETTLRGINSVAVFSADGLKVVNANDAMGVHLVSKIAANIGTADLLMGHYGGASPYPQCFSDIEDKKAAAENVIRATSEMLITAAEALNCKYIFPFAGQYILCGRLATLNKDRATLPLDQAVNFLRKLTTREIISLRPSGTLDLTSNTREPEYIEPDHIDRVGAGNT